MNFLIRDAGGRSDALSRSVRLETRPLPAGAVSTLYQWSVDRVLFSESKQAVMSRAEFNDAVWNTAWEWIVKEHEHSLDAAARDQLVAWLQDPTHRSTA